MIKVDRVGFEPTTSAMPQLSSSYSLFPFKREVSEREKLFNIRRSIFHAL
jgi:hypothetical protein